MAGRTSSEARSTVKSVGGRTATPKSDAPDLVIRRATLVDVTTGELRPADVCVKAGRITAVLAPGSAGKARSEIDACGLFLAPGFIDMAARIETAMVSPQHYADTVLPHGVTTAVWRKSERPSSGQATGNIVKAAGKLRLLSSVDDLGGNDSFVIATSAGELTAMLRDGLSVIIDGSYPQALPDFVKALKRLPQFPLSLTLSSGHCLPDTLDREGGLIALMQRLVRNGLAPLHVIKAATINAAIALGRKDLGIVAPGRAADLVLLDDLNDLTIHTVIAGGTIVDRTAMRRPVIAATGAGVPLPCGHIEADHFRIATDSPAISVAAAPGDAPYGQMEGKIRKGMLALPDDVVMVALIDPHSKRAAKPDIRFISGFGRWRGAFATTLSYAPGKLLVIGRAEQDMAVAANSVIDAGGGMAVAADGWVHALMALPQHDIGNRRSLPEAAEALATIRDALATVVDWPQPFMLFRLLTGLTPNARPPAANEAEDAQSLMPIAAAG
ncbi:adenine deaminase C-terminal domain-containing protein [Martelella sp. HB161492]|uniref:adenine deaminase C-terminal domain-containing protein n=1 Tax=Martelella sp. HB161492 TaxID=2720726 RepID=UPI0015925183|nr:adenine deaminase C-terminal domain-containing protein [Martelella sp. HB161492]